MTGEPLAWSHLLMAANPRAAPTTLPTLARPRAPTQSAISNQHSGQAGGVHLGEDSARALGAAAGDKGVGVFHPDALAVLLLDVDGDALADDCLRGARGGEEGR